MFQCQDIFDALKDLASNDVKEGQSHCQMVEFHSRRLGFQSYHHLRETLKNLPSDRFDKISLKLMRKVCLTRIPLPGSIYYEFHIFSITEYGFYSRWIGWDKLGKEVRAPRLLLGDPSVVNLRAISNLPVYVIGSSREMLAWRFNWRGIAYVPESFAKEAFPSAFSKESLVEKDPPMDLVKKNGGHDDDFVRRN